MKNREAKFRVKSQNFAQPFSAKFKLTINWSLNSQWLKIPNKNVKFKNDFKFCKIFEIG